MNEPVSTKSAKQNGRNQSEGHARPPEQQASVPGPQAHILGLQHAAGNQAVNRLLQTKAAGLSSAGEQAHAGPESQAELVRRAGAEPGRPLDEGVRAPLEQALGEDLGGVRLHAGPAAAASSESLDARAYTVGSDIYLGPEARRADARERNRLLAHEVVHTVQQGGRPVALQGVLPVSRPADRAEVEAACVAETVAPGGAGASPSPALALRNSLRASPVAPSIQRDIKGSKKLPHGKFEIDFKKTNAAAAGDRAAEKGTVTFTPGAKAPESDSIRFVQIVRTFDTAAKDELDWTGTAEANRNKMSTKSDKAKTITPGFYVDQQAGSLAQRTKKADPEVLPYYDVTGPPIAANRIGKRRGKTIDPAVLKDSPGSSEAIKFSFVSAAKAADTGTWYGTVLWGFETFLDKKGVAKIKNEYHSFRAGRGKTMDAAVKAFDDFYQNPGATTAPTK